MVAPLPLFFTLTFLLASCSVYDNYDEATYNAYYGVGVDSPGGAGPNEQGGVNSSNSNNGGGAPSSSEGISSVASSDSHEVPESSATTPESSDSQISSSSVLDDFECGIDKIVDSKDDNRTYATIQIGSQCWLAVNSMRTVGESRCYGDKPENCEKYGRLYKFVDAQKACPAGTRLPKVGDWATLSGYYGDTFVVASNLKDPETWVSKKGNGEGNFNALAAGKTIDVDEFAALGSFAGFWNQEGKVTYMTSSDNKLYNDVEMGKDILLSVRCIVE